jgi:aminoglycoside 6'-N-acetyltransferase-1b
MHFRQVTESDFPTLTEWLNRPHVAQWWDDCTSLAQVREMYLPCLSPDSSVVPYFACLDDVPIGYIQSYVAASVGDGWWPDEHDPGVHGIDQFLADELRLGQGLGPEMVGQFVQFLFADPAVTRIQADPSPRNTRAIRCYEKAGFRNIGPVNTPDGIAILMVVERVVAEPS